MTNLAKGVRPDDSRSQPTQSGSETYEAAWSISGDGGDLERLVNTFNRLARRAVVALGPSRSNPANAVDVWLNSLHRFHKDRRHRYASNHWEIKNIFEASAEYCAELSTGFHEAGNTDEEEIFAGLERQFRQLADQRADPLAIRRRDETRLQRDRYPLNNWLYDQLVTLNALSWKSDDLDDYSHKSLADPKMELDYRKAHAWKGYHILTESYERLDGTRMAYADRHEKLNFAIGGLSYDLFVLQANYVIDIGLRGKEAMEAFDDAKPLDEVVSSWRASCKRLVLSFEDESKGIERLSESRDRIRGDLQRLLPELPAEPQNRQAQGGTEHANSHKEERAESIPTKKQRRERRSSWLDREYERMECTSDLDIKAKGGPTYNTMRRYRSGETSNRDRSVRLDIARALGRDVGDVPE